MLRATLIRRAHVHKPSIRFPDRKKPVEPHQPHPHPAAPPEIAKDFGHFQEVFSSGPHFHPEKIAAESSPSASSSEGSAPGVVDDVRQLPERFWKKASILEPDEMEAIMSGGASLRA